MVAHDNVIQGGMALNPYPGYGVRVYINKPYFILAI